MSTLFKSEYRLALEAAADTLAAALDGLDAEAALRQAADDLFPGRICAVSSFGAESAVILHMISRIDPDMPVILVDTGKLFSETLAYRDLLQSRLELTRIKAVGPDAHHLQADDPTGDLHARDADLCCHVRKTQPLIRALRPYDVWISGRKRHHGAERAALPRVEIQDGKLKLNPLYDWGRADIAAYLDRHDLPAHPLVAQGYPSIGCTPCTAPVANPGDDPRAGRWAGLAKTECGIHLGADGMLRRGASG